jgi:type I restriction enzyme M protein
VVAGEYLRENKPELFADAKAREHFHNGMFNGYDFDTTMLRIGSMNMLLHGVENADIQYRDSLSQDYAVEDEKYSLILANPPFAGSLNKDDVAKDLLKVVDTKSTELLFLALFLKLLKPGGRAAVIVPDGVLFGSSKAHKELRRLLVEDQKLDGIVSLPSGAFKPYAGVSTAILLFTKTNSGGTDKVWFYDVTADGRSLDDKRTELLSDDKLGAVPTTPLTEAEHDKNNLPDALTRWRDRAGNERDRPRTAQSFCVDKADIVAQGYDLSLNRYKEVIHQEVEHRHPKDILADLTKLEEEIQQGIRDLEAML